MSPVSDAPAGSNDQPVASGEPATVVAGDDNRTDPDAQATCAPWQKARENDPVSEETRCASRPCAPSRPRAIADLLTDDYARIVQAQFEAAEAAGVPEGLQANEDDWGDDDRWQVPKAPPAELPDAL